MSDVAEPIGGVERKKQSKQKQCDILTVLIVIFIITCLVFCPKVLAYILAGIVFGGIGLGFIVMLIGGIHEAVSQIFNPQPKHIVNKR
jgi:accessory gene regulator protein AgrB